MKVIVFLITALVILNSICSGQILAPECYFPNPNDPTYVFAIVEINRFYRSNGNFSTIVPRGIISAMRERLFSPIRRPQYTYTLKMQVSGDGSNVEECDLTFVDNVKVNVINVYTLTRRVTCGSHNN